MVVEQNQFNTINATNIKDVLEQKCIYYNSKIEELRSLVDASIEVVSKKRQSLLQGLAVDVGGDLSLVARIRLQIYGAKYYTDLMDNYSFYLKDLLNVLRLYSSAETRPNFV